MDIGIAIQDFITVHEIENHSPYTIRNYRRHLENFRVWIQSVHGIVDTDEIQVAHLRGWVSHLQKQAVGRLDVCMSDRTVNQYGVSLIAFCHWLEKEGVMEKLVTERFKLPRVEQKFVPTFTPDEVEKLFNACEEDKSLKPQLRKALTARNRAILSVFIDTGIRLSELVGLRLCDVDRDLRLLIVHRKGNKWQQVPISREGFKPLHDYLTKHRPYLAALGGKTVARKEDAVFLSMTGEPLTDGGIWMLFYRLRKRTGITGKRVSPHNCRRSMATTQLAMGRSPLDVQRQMGHTTLKMTNHYASLTVEQLQKSHERYSPLRAKHMGSTEAFGTGYWDE